jgi:two-component system chemotaxis response regulator CheY
MSSSDPKTLGQNGARPGMPSNGDSHADATLRFAGHGASVSFLESLKIRALIVDDNRTMRQILRQLLGQAGIQDVVEADNGINAIDMLSRVGSSAPPDLILCDLHMDKMDGMEFLSHVRRGRTSIDVRTPVLMLTGETDQFVLDVTEQVGATAVLKKPISTADLTAEIWRVIGLKV